MIERTLKTTGGKLRVSIPSQLNEVTLGQMIAMQQKPELNDVEAISILSGVPVDELKSVKNIGDFHEFGKAILLLSYQIKYLYNSEVIPKQVTFHLNGRTNTVKSLQNLSVEPAGAFMAARDIIAEEINTHIKEHGEDNWQDHFNPSLNACCQVLAHYFYCRATGESYNEYKVEEFTEEIKKLKVTEALPISRHFFTCYPNLSKPKTGFWHRLLQQWRNGRAYNRSRSLGTSIQ